jgi:hypothetical protein
MDLQSRHNDQIEAIDAARVQASLNRGTRGGGNSPDALQTINSQFMRNPDDPEKGIPVKWDGKSPPMSQLEFNNFFKNRNLDKVQDDINRKHLLDGLRENKQELDRAKNAAAIIGNSKIKEDDPAKIAAHAYLDSVAKVKFGVEAPKKQTWKEWASDIVGLKPTPEAVTQSKAIAHPYQPQTMAPTHTQEEWDSTVKQYLDAGVSGEDILDHAQNDPMAVQALINNGAGVKK